MFHIDGFTARVDECVAAIPAHIRHDLSVLLEVEINQEE